ncbi:acetate--CoA ligase [Desulfosarcina widdelii]|uniref:Acetate--CoA ligase n=1 Tax=Desulfosarcina widdelii TaxID=947919 RepID=A0A5K7Z1T5_9BACT|nr:AMP-binding protein [Desulfosarcina widdelii]BBO74620.1 acetate--CoA ligase [Desulfosarcina widdelii]
MQYEKLYHDFKWDDFCDELFDWDWRKQFNIAQAVLDRNTKDPKKIALYHVKQKLDVNVFTFGDLRSLTNKFANALQSLGLKKGDRVARLLPRIPETYVSFLGTWKSGMVDVPLYTAFGPDAIAYRIQDSEAKALITDQSNLDRLTSISDLLKEIQVIVVNPESENPSETTTTDFGKLIKEADDADLEVETTTDDLALLVYTSGTTGPPKGTTISHNAILSVLPYAKYCLDIHENEMFWGFADPGWVYGLLSAGSAPMALGAALVVFEPGFDAESWYQTIAKLKITNFTAAPTAFRAIMASGKALAEKYKPRFRYLSSAGEPLNPEVIRWFESEFGTPIRDMYGISEVSMVIGNNPCFGIKSGSCGKPIPGFTVKLKGENGCDCKDAEIGSICVKQNDHFISNGYWGLEEKYRKSFVDDNWFDTGDLAYRDEDGYYFFVGRKDDVISSSGYRIGPFEVENCIIEHPAVAECAVVGKPDTLRGEIVKAFIVLNKNYTASEALKKDVIELCRDRLSKHNYPREIDFIKELPKTSSGKIQRRKLRK